MTTEIDQQKPSIKDCRQWQGASRELTAPSVWPFSVRWQDKHRIDDWFNEGFADKELAILGPPQAVDAGIRILTPIVEMARTMEIIRENNLGMPNPYIVCPIHINAEVNNIQIEDNEAMAKDYLKLAERYFAVFHPDLPYPRLVSDNPLGVTLLKQYASQIKDHLSSSTLDVLLDMAEKHSKGDNLELLIESTTAYLLAHYVVYGYISLPEYYSLEKQTLIIVPQSEQKFHNLMDAEIEIVSSTFPEITPPTDDGNGSMVIGYSHALKSAHYYPHRGERHLKDCSKLWPTRKQLSRQPGLNGLARDEIWEAVRLIEVDISRSGPRIMEINKLQKEVLSSWNR